MKNFNKLIVMLIGVLMILPIADAADQYQGLWSGQIAINKVNELGMNVTDTTTPKPVANPFDMPILLHVDATGKVRLLREVTVMQTDPVNGVVRRVLVTDDTKLSQFRGVVKRDGKLIGIRMGSLGFDFDSGNEKELTGAFGTGSTVTGTLSLDKNHPNNPFRHLYHPEHKVGRSLQRDITLTFDATQTGNAEAGIASLKGTYKEKISGPNSTPGIHKAPIYVEGTFILQRVSVIDKLNQ